MVPERRKNASFIMRFIGLTCFTPLASNAFKLIMQLELPIAGSLILSLIAASLGLFCLNLSHTVLWENKGDLV